MLPVIIRSVCRIRGWRNKAYMVHVTPATNIKIDIIRNPATTMSISNINAREDFIESPAQTNNVAYPNSADKVAFHRLGHSSFTHCLHPDFVKILNHEIERTLRGDYDHAAPDRMPKLVKTPLTQSLAAPLGFGGSFPTNSGNSKVVQIVNIWKSNLAFTQLVTNGLIGQVA